MGSAAAQPRDNDGGTDPFAAAFVTLFVSFGVFLLAWLARYDWRVRQRNLSLANTRALTNPSESPA